MCCDARWLLSPNEVVTTATRGGDLPDSSRSRRRASRSSGDNGRQLTEAQVHNTNTGSAQLLKTIRMCCDPGSNGTPEQAIHAFEEACERGASFDGVTINGYVGMLLGRNDLSDATRALQRLDEVGQCPLNPQQLSALVVGIPQTCVLDPVDVAAFVDAAVVCTRGLVHGEFFRRRARWAALEFASEAQAALADIAGRDPQSLARQGRCIFGCTLDSGSKAGEVVLRGGNDGGGDARRNIMKGDSVALAPMDQAPPLPSAWQQQQQGGAAAMGGAYGPGAGQQQQQGSSGLLLVEAEVLNLMPLVIKIADKRAQSQVLARARGGGGGVRWRIDKLANRISFERAIASLHLLATAARDADDGGGGGGGGGGARRGGKYGGADQGPGKGELRPHDAIVAAVTAPAPGSVPGVAVDVAQFCGRPCTTPDGRRVDAADDRGRRTGGMELNPSQHRAVQAATSRRLTLIQGPPGTGKTAASVRILQHWAQSRCHGEQVLACSDSNIAVDNLLEGLLKAGVAAVRVGRPESTRPELLQYCADEMAQQAARLADPGSAKQAAHDARTRAIRAARVVCATCVGVGSGTLDKYRFGGVLVDEASQATELATLVATTRGCQQLVLVGDHCQLPPTVASEVAAAEGLSVSLFDRLVQAGVSPFMLDTQYRMHPAISMFPSDCFYGGTIADGIVAADRPTLAGFNWPRPEWPVAFLNVQHSREETDGPSKLNRVEAQAVASVVKGLLDGGLTPLQIGVITPYAAQVRVLRGLLRHVGRELEISSVDGFQGREKAAMVVSTVRANSGGSVGFLQDWRRANVALTRAQRGLVVVGHGATLSSESRSWRPWLLWAYDMGIVVGESRVKNAYDQEATRKLADLRHHPLPAPLGGGAPQLQFAIQNGSSQYGPVESAVHGPAQAPSNGLPSASAYGPLQAAGSQMRGANGDTAEAKRRTSRSRSPAAKANGGDEEDRGRRRRGRSASGGGSDRSRSRSRRRHRRKRSRSRSGSGGRSRHRRRRRRSGSSSGGSARRSRDKSPRGKARRDSRSRSRHRQRSGRRHSRSRSDDSARHRRHRRRRSTSKSGSRASGGGGSGGARRGGDRKRQQRSRSGERATRGRDGRRRSASASRKNGDKAKENGDKGKDNSDRHSGRRRRDRSASRSRSSTRHSEKGEGDEKREEGGGGSPGRWNGGGDAESV
ncbi:P-loop containing nucleoside triphosphate hydrolase protein [Tribonema minus]|uniref:P-loop containing nucleoside triphosphate hydrolase protein n=1 Tax=Tribonema minus TaxID=303371 RepID=A0A835Z889_9STRA|nr:P-loop containing nucleoside triphosphate hydrolase protein [Tribonema minus]